MYALYIKSIAEFPFGYFWFRVPAALAEIHIFRGI